MPGELAPVEQALELGFTRSHMQHAIAFARGSKYNEAPERRTLKALLKPGALVTLAQQFKLGEAKPKPVRPPGAAPPGWPQERLSLEEINRLSRKAVEDLERPGQKGSP